MPLQFHDDAIILSGLYGTKLKTDIIAAYYGFWLKVVTAPKFNEVNIVEMDAGTCEVYIEDNKRIMLGSAGHALDLRYKKYQNRLNIVLIEKDPDCRKHMDNVLAKRWPSASFTRSSSKNETSTDGWVTRYVDPDDFLDVTKDGAIKGISLFYFDPLLSVEWNLIDRIAKTRITKPFKTGTEFLIFFFTSDWLYGRRTDEGRFEPLPKKSDETSWYDGQQYSARIADVTFGNRGWLDVMTSGKTNRELENGLVELYKKNLRKWFRFVVPLPFVPKDGQIYHVFCCSNFEVGTSVLSSIYKSRTSPFGLQADNRETYKKFKEQHPSIMKKYSGNKRPPEWKVLWCIMKDHADGICDEECRTIGSSEKIHRPTDLPRVLDWLRNEEYLKEISITDWPWETSQFPVYKINWDTTRERLGVEKPLPPSPLIRPD